MVKGKYNSIRSLDTTSSRLLCAGQAITDVSRVVKELVENSLDAGGSRIVVKLTSFGLDRIQVEDDGCGIWFGLSSSAVEMESGTDGCERCIGGVSGSGIGLGDCSVDVKGKENAVKRGGFCCSEGQAVRTTLLESRSTSKRSENAHSAFRDPAYGRGRAPDSEEERCVAGNSLMKRSKEKRAWPLCADSARYGTKENPVNALVLNEETEAACSASVTRKCILEGRRHMDFVSSSDLDVDRDYNDPDREDNASEKCTSSSSNSSLGFRGEALYVLAQLSKVEIWTRCAEEEEREATKKGNLAGGGRRPGCVTYYCHYDPCEAATARSQNEPYHTVVSLLSSGSPGWRSQRGTTLTAHNLFRNLPVRRREAERHQRSHLLRVVQLVKQYAISHPWVQLLLLHQERPPDGETVTLVSLRGTAPPPLSPHPSTWWNTSLLARGIADAYGGGTLTRLQAVAWVLCPSSQAPSSFGGSSTPIRPASTVDANGVDAPLPSLVHSPQDQSEREYAERYSSALPAEKERVEWGGKRTTNGASEMTVHVRGFVWKLDAAGRSGKDWQVWVMDGRLVDLPRWSKAVDSAYRSCLPHALQSRHVAFFLHVWTERIASTTLQREDEGEAGKRWDGSTSSPGLSYDVNVSPDKREIIMVEEQACVEALYQKARETFYAWSQGVQIALEGGGTKERHSGSQHKGVGIGLGGGASGLHSKQQLNPITMAVAAERQILAANSRSSLLSSSFSSSTSSIISKEEEMEEEEQRKLFFRMQTEEERSRLGRLQEAEKKRKAAALLTNFTSYVWRGESKKEEKEESSHHTPMCTTEATSSSVFCALSSTSSQDSKANPTIFPEKETSADGGIFFSAETSGMVHPQKVEAMDARQKGTSMVVQVAYDLDTADFCFSEEEDDGKLDSGYSSSADMERVEEETSGERVKRRRSDSIHPSGFARRTRLENGRRTIPSCSPSSRPYGSVFTPFPSLSTLWTTSSSSLAAEDLDDSFFSFPGPLSPSSSSAILLPHRSSPPSFPLSLHQSLSANPQVRPMGEMKNRNMPPKSHALRSMIQKEASKRQQGKKHANKQKKQASGAYILDQSDTSLNQLFRKSFFTDMEIHGQFNLGFIIASVMVDRNEERSENGEPNDIQAITPHEQETVHGKKKKNVCMNVQEVGSRDDANEDEQHAQRRMHEDARISRKEGGVPSSKVGTQRKFSTPSGRRVLMVIDQHASDEKANYERLLREYVPRPQPLVCPVTLSLDTEEVRLALVHQEELRKEHGFEVGPVEMKVEAGDNRTALWPPPQGSECDLERSNALEEARKEETTMTCKVHHLDDDADELPLHSRASLTNTDRTPSTMHHPTRLKIFAIPTLPYDNVHPTAISELLQHLQRYGTLTTHTEQTWRHTIKERESNAAPPPAMQLRAVWHSLATKACRTSIMIGTALQQTQMERIVRRLSGLSHPWCCPHGRPTLRCLGDLFEDWEYFMPSCQQDYYYYHLQRRSHQKGEGSEKCSRWEDHDVKEESDSEEREGKDNKRVEKEGKFENDWEPQESQLALSKPVGSAKAKKKAKKGHDAGEMNLSEVVWKDGSAASSFFDFQFRFDFVGSLVA